MAGGQSTKDAEASDTSAESGQGDYVPIDILYSSTKKHRVVVTRDAAGRFWVDEERWHTGDAETKEPSHWCPYGRTSTITDTLENARQLGREKLALREPGIPKGEDVEQ